MKSAKNPEVLTKEKEVELYCSDCHERIETSNVNLSDALAKCESCNSLFSLEDAEFVKRRGGRPIYLVPEGTDVLKLITSLEISTSWFRATKKDKMKFDFIFAMTFGVMSSIGLFAGITAFSLLMTLISTVFFIIGIVFTYNYIANLINKTYVTIDEDSLKIKHKPLKFFSWKEYDINIESIRQIYVKEYKTNMTVNDKPLYAFGIFAKTDDEKEIKIIDDMNRETSLFIEQEIEEFLDIRDKKMKGEIKK